MRKFKKRKKTRKEKKRRTTPPPPRSEEFAALTIDVTPRVVMDVWMRDIFEFKADDGAGLDASGGGAWRREDLYRSERVGIELSWVV